MNRPLAFLSIALFIVGCHPKGVVLPGDTGMTDGDADADTDADTDTDTEPVDEDGDGYTDDVDCDDGDPDINPDAEETYDGVDNDCDGWVDEIDVCDDGAAPFSHIQDAIDYAGNGDVVAVCPGTYPENLVIYNKALTLASMEGPDVTVVDGGGATVLTIHQVGGDGVSVQGLTFQNGQAEEYGGGILCVEAGLELIDNVVRDCEAPAGAGMITSSCHLSVSGNVFQDNHAAAGGGAYIYESRGEITGNAFTGNSANQGGGILIYGNEISFSENDVYGNYAAFQDQASASGAGLYSDGSSAITDNHFFDNESEDDGGGAFIRNGSGVFTGNTVSDNICWNDGAGLYTWVSGALIQDNVFERNIAYDDAGGLRVYVGYSDVIDNEFYDNEAGDDGGGMKASHSYSNSFSGLYFEGNVAGDAGGGLELDNETSPLTDSVFVGNSADRGGGVHNWRNEHMENTLSFLHFEGNDAVDCGGAIQLDNMQNTVRIHSSSFTGNTADDGSAICADEIYWDANDDGESDTMIWNHVALSNLLIHGDESWDDGAIYLRVADGTVSNVTITDHVGGGSTGLAIKGGSDVILSNSIIADTRGGPALYVIDSTLRVFYSDLWDNEGGDTYGTSFTAGADGNIAADPAFTDAAGSDYNLGASSPCVDAGDPAAGSSDADGSRNDMGAYGGPLGGW